MKITDTRKVNHRSQQGHEAIIRLDPVQTQHGLLAITVKAFLTDTGNLSITGTALLNGKDYTGGQIQDTIQTEYMPHVGNQAERGRLMLLLKIWDFYHLNDLKAGTPEQHMILRAMPDPVWPMNWYTAACAYLKERNKYVVDVEGQPYKFGSAWLTHEIPAGDLAKIRGFLFPSHFPAHEGIL